jgi:hypothetical protein
MGSQIGECICKGGFFVHDKTFADINFFSDSKTVGQPPPFLDDFHFLSTTARNECSAD